MRNAFAKTLTELAHTQEDLVLLSADIGNRLFDDFKEAHPERFYNLGVAEANTIGVAAGLAMNGLRPIAYTIASFLIYRPYEQIRIDLAYHKLPVTLVGVGGGLSYASNGATHHSLEDIAVMSALPNMKVVCPADRYEVEAALRASTKEQGPLYIRMGKKNEPNVHNAVPANFKIGEALPIKPGSKVALLATGNITPNALEAAIQLDRKGISTAVLSFHTVKPLDTLALAECFGQYDAVISIEEHSLRGGLGAAILLWGSQNGAPLSKFHAIGTDDRFLHESASQNYARKCFGLDPEGIAQRVEQCVLRRPAHLSV